MDKGEVKMIDRKDIFMSGFKSKIGYSFTYKDLNEFEAIIDFYEQQCKKQQKIINKLEILIENLKLGVTLNQEQEDLLNKVLFGDLQQENKQLKDNWNKIKEYIGTEWYCFDNESVEFKVAKNILNKMQELENGTANNCNECKQCKGSDNNG